MLILHIIDHWGLGGAQRALVTLMRHELTHKHRVAALSSNKHHHWNLPAQPYFLGENTADIFHIISRLRCLLKTLNPDILHVHLSGSRFILWLAALGLENRPPVIWHEHSGEEIYYRFGTLTGKIMIHLQRLMLSRITSVIADSSYIEAFCKHHYGVRPPKLRLIYYPIDKEEILSQAKHSVANKPLNVQKEGDIVGFVGRLSYQKGLDDFFEVTNRLLTIKPQCRIWIVGDGPLKEHCFEKVKDSYHADRYVFWGTRDDVYAIMQQMDILLMPSHYEPFGLVAVEAFILGKPVVGYKVGGLLKLLEGSPLGFGIPHGNTDAMIRQVVNLLERHDKIESREDNLYDASLVSRQWSKYYQEVHEKNPANGK